jgi:zinc transporter ZupT
MNNMNVMYMLTGAIAMGSFAIALYFLRFWRTSRDRFFLYFALSFGIEGVHRVYAALSFENSEDSPLHYLVRLLAYGLILVAILEKNLPTRGASE